MTKCDPLLLAVAACAAASPLVHAQDVKPRHTLTGHRLLYCVAFSADGKVLASGDLRGAIKVWDVATGKELATLSKAVRTMTRTAAPSRRPCMRWRSTPTGASWRRAMRAGR